MDARTNLDAPQRLDEQVVDCTRVAQCASQLGLWSDIKVNGDSRVLALTYLEVLNLAFMPDPPVDGFLGCGLQFAIRWNCGE